MHEKAFFAVYMLIVIIYVAVCLSFSTPLEVTVIEGSSTRICVTLTGGTIDRSIPVTFIIQDNTATSETIVIPYCIVKQGEFILPGLKID